MLETDLRTLTLIGKATFQVEQQELEGGAIDIIVATPGRLVDHIRGTGAVPVACLFLEWLLDWVGVVGRSSPLFTHTHTLSLASPISFSF